MSIDDLFTKNKHIYLLVVIAVFLFGGVVILEKSQTVENLIPILRGEVTLKNGIVITCTKDGSPLLVKKNDPLLGKHLRVSGMVNSVFSDTILELCRSNDVVVEVGSYFGYNSVLLGKKVKNGIVYCLEPNSFIFPYLRKNIIINDLESVCILKSVAVSSSKGDCDIEDYFEVAEDRQKKNGTNSTKKKQLLRVSCSTLDHEIQGKTGSVNLLAIDIPGLEFLILGGAMKILNESPNIVVVVTFQKKEAAKNVDVESELDQLHAEGFRFYLAQGKNDISPITIGEILELTGNIVLIFSKKPL
ncbi:MAG: FkbM family methyltransferase [Holosporaceae bacterium]|nr:FkbM family methyltransferase [Holosporaceae bacterium]